MISPAHPVLILAGPTAVGKSSLAMKVAHAVGGEIVSADSRQVYRGLSIGTAKPSASDRQRIPHHFLDILDPGQPYSAGQFAEDARHAIHAIQTRGNVPIVTGGSTLYVHALVAGLADLPPLAPSTLRDVEAEASTAEGREALFAELLAADPTTADTLDATKTQRLIRFVGLLREHGSLPSEAWRHAQPGIPHELVVLERPRPELYQRINARVKEMIDQGLVEEVQRLAGSAPHALPLLQATIGYREVLTHLAGEGSEAHMIERIQTHSRRYAKRQLTWYRRYDHARWLSAGTERTLQELTALASSSNNA